MRTKFNEICKNWLENSCMKLEDLEEDDYSLKETSAHLSICGSHLHIYVTINKNTLDFIVIKYGDRNSTKNTYIRF